MTKNTDLVISVPVNEKYSNTCNPNGHMRRYSIELIKAELKIAGFKIIEIRTLIAFNKNYLLKKIIAKYILRNKWQPNVVIIKAKLAD
jgi:hypothetical protein